jgi:single-stranded-DNA-specific exonuclease
MVAAPRAPPHTKLDDLVDTPKLTVRKPDPDTSTRLQAAGIHPLLARLWSARGVVRQEDVQLDWPAMLAPNTLTQAEHAAELLADAIADGKRMLIVADYDCDGATACAVGMRALTEMGAIVDFLVPNRFETGYGLSPAVVELACQHPSGRPDLLITVDNGIASVDGVAAANAAGIGVIVTDHHLPGDQLPQALAIVNPNQHGCDFPSKNLAGVGVIFYLMLALRAELRRRGQFPANGGPRLDALADLVALGTVADVVKLDANNRLLVTRGLERMRRGLMQPGIRALFAVAARDPQAASAFDLGFALGPRINAAGRLADMGLGIRCLITNDEMQALELARELDTINRERRQIENVMKEQALEATDSVQAGKLGASVCVFHPEWHQGVVGLVASRLKEKFFRPTLAFAPAGDEELRGSGRSIPDVHLRDVLDLVSKRHPGLIRKFGGHAMAAGLTLGKDDFDRFAPAFDLAVIELTGRTSFEPVIETDGSLEEGYANVQVANILEQQVWGAGFAAPLFLDTFKVQSQKLVGEKHLKLSVQRGHQRFDAIWFNHTDRVPEFIKMAYRLDQNVWNGVISVQLIVEHAEAA